VEEVDSGKTLTDYLYGDITHQKSFGDILTLESKHKRASLGESATEELG